MRGRRALRTIWQSFLIRCVLGATVLIALFCLWGYAEFGSLAGAAAYLRGERLMITPAVFDLGELREGEKRELFLEATNLGSAPARIVGSSSNCSCIVPEELPMTVPAGTSRKIKVLVTGAFVDGTAVFSQDVVFFTDVHAQPICRITIIGKNVDALEGE